MSDKVHKITVTASQGEISCVEWFSSVINDDEDSICWSSAHMPKDNFEIHCSLRDNFINGARNLSDGQFYFFVSGLNDTGEILF